MNQDIRLTQYGCFVCGEIWMKHPSNSCAICQNKNILSFKNILDLLLELDIDYELPLHFQKAIGRG